MSYLLQENIKAIHRIWSELNQMEQHPVSSLIGKRKHKTHTKNLATHADLKAAMEHLTSETDTVITKHCDRNRNSTYLKPFNSVFLVLPLES